MDVPNKVKIFLGKACNNCLPTLENLSRPKVQVELWCPSCQTGMEDGGHVLFLFKMAKEMWNMVGLFELINKFSQQEAGARNSLMVLERIQWRCLLFLSTSTINSVKESTNDQVQVGNRNAQNMWSIPPVGKLKVNFDGAVFKDLNAIGIGVLRDQDGRFISGRTKRFSGSCS
ncbi:hypothetical protein ACH5RR_038779 [Cinchona calisaya]|uniref:Reverse transcriptase zinc-binding domain-containing protein n=1 Tax=Cinchona calisaya TaxID=153742 RepID=A0ABD2XWA2_9GENT